MASILDLVIRQYRRLISQNKDVRTLGNHNGAYLTNDLEAIERQTGRTISIATRTTPQNLQKSHPQDQSPLFALPAELRTLILTYALTPDPRQDSFDAQFFHPMDRFSTQILQTCRRIWLEANAIPFQHAVPEFFLYRTTSLPGAADELAATVRGIVELDRFLRSLTPNNIERVHLSVNADIDVLRQHNYLKTFAISHGKWPLRVTITLRFRTVSVWPFTTLPGVESEEVDGMVAEMLQNAALVGIRRFAVKLQVVKEQKSGLNLTFRRLSTAASRDNFASGWSLDANRCEGPRADARPEKNHVQVAVLEWYRNVPRQQARGGNEVATVRRQQTRSASAHLNRWKMEESLLHFIE